MPLSEKEKIKARDELKMLYGHAPHNGPGNICYGDGYFARSLTTKYGMSIKELKEAVKS